MICIDALNTDGDANLSLMLPEWIDGTALTSRFDDLQSAAYVRGLSDSTVVNVCDYCDCCLIFDGTANDGGLMPWEGASQAMQMIPISGAEE
jgi:hypothetical protein